MRVRVEGEEGYQGDGGGDLGCDLGDVRCLCYCDVVIL